MHDDLFKRIMHARSLMFTRREKTSDMDSGIVSAEIREQVRPLLEERGFTQFSTRIAWRYHQNRIDVLNFQSFSRYAADKFCCTTYSFQVNLGSFVPDHDWCDTKTPNGLLRPHDACCSFRRSLMKTIDQPECRSRTIWYVDERGRNLREVVADARAVIERDAFDWFDFWRDDRAVIELLESGQKPLDGTLDYPRKPMSGVMIGTLKARLRKQE